MIDLETLDTTPGCVILSLGAVKFRPNSDEEPFDELYFRLNVDQQLAKGRTISDSTLAWWAKQDPKIQEEAFSDENRIDVEEVVNRLHRWVFGANVVWGHGYGFDITILEDLFRMYNKSIPWNFWQVRDSRTLFSILPEDPRKSMQTDLHNALADAYFQAKAVQKANLTIAHIRHYYDGVSGVFEQS